MMLQSGFIKIDQMIGGNVTRGEELQLTEICCRIISEDTVLLNERIWMSELISKCDKAKKLVVELLQTDILEEELY